MTAPLTPCPPSPTASDASSEHSAGSQSLGAESISSRNTLLAAAGYRGSRKATSTSTSSSSGSLSAMAGRLEEQLGTMDTDFLHPEDLWKQPNKGSVLAAFFLPSSTGGGSCKASARLLKLPVPGTSNKKKIR